MSVDFKMFVEAGVAAPEGGLAIAVFRIFQEILSNIARHAQAHHVWIRIDVNARRGCSMSAADAQPVGDPNKYRATIIAEARLWADQSVTLVLAMPRTSRPR